MFFIIFILFIELIKFSLTSEKTPLLGGSGSNHAQRNIQVPFRLRSSNGGSGGLRSYAGQQVGGRWTLQNNRRHGNSQRKNRRHRHWG
uniref:Secreted protein n=1 Tax=Strongyloides papillosus TaxID=174720 RepID=A0A0N5BY03_STREA